MVLDLAEPVAVLVQAYHVVLDPDDLRSSDPPPPGSVTGCLDRVWLLEGHLVCELDVEEALAPRQKA